MRRVTLFVASTFVMASFGSIANADSDTDNYLRLLKENAGQTKCVQLKRIIDTSTTINFDGALYSSISYQADCAYKEVKQFASNPYPSNLAWSTFTGVFGRSGQVVYNHGLPDHGEYGVWLPTIKNIIEIGGILVPNSPVKTYSELLATVARWCEVPQLAIQTVPFIRQNGGDPTARVEIRFSRRANGNPIVDSAQNVMRRQCPNLSYLLQ